MQEDTSKDFDLQVKAMMEGAEEEVPREIWGAISSRLDAAAPVRTPFWKVAGIALAAAAALAAGLFFTGTLAERQLSVSEDAVAVSEAELAAVAHPYIAGLALKDGPDAPEPPAADVDAAGSPVPLHSTSVKTASQRGTAAVMRRSPAAESGSTATAGTQAASTAGGATAAGTQAAAAESPAGTGAVPTAGAGATAAAVKGSASTAAAGTAAAAVKGTAPKAGPATAPDAFAVMAMEDAAGGRAPRLSAMVHGCLGGNDAEYSLSGRRARIAYGKRNHPGGLMETSISTYGIPVSFGAGLKLQLDDRLAIGTAVDWTLLTRTFAASYDGDSDCDVYNRMHYIGIPLNLYYDIIRSGHLSLYLYGGGMAEYCVSNKYDISSGSGRTSVSEPVDALQWSVGGGLGVEFSISDKLGLYIDPSVRYYFDCGQPKSLRTDKPFMTNFETGLRFKF